MKYKCLILDHDDTVVNSTATIHYPSFIAYLKEYRPERVKNYMLEDFIAKNFNPGIVSLFRDELELTDEYLGDDAIMIATDAGSMFIPLREVIDFEKERARLNAEMAKNEAEIQRLEKKLSNEGFVSKAPAQVIAGERAKLERYLETREALREALAKLN